MTVDELSRDPTATYIGDGVYARHDGYQIWLHTSDGYQVSPGIALERDVYLSLKRYADGLYGVKP